MYGYVGRQMARRQASADGRLAVVLFAAWWYSVAGITAITALQDVVAAFGYLDLALFETFAHIWLAGACVAYFSLLYYLAYLFTGQRGLIVPLAAAYSVLYVALVYVVAYLHPVAVDVQTWRATVVFERAMPPLVSLVLVTVLLGPHLVGAVAYLSLFFRLEDRTQRYRVGMVAMSILGWFATAFLASALHLTKLSWWPLASILIGCFASILILMAYSPPRIIRDRYGISSV